MVAISRPARGSTARAVCSSVNGGGKVDHMGGSIVGLRLSTFRGNVRLSVQQKCHLSNPGSYQMSTAPVVHFADALDTGPVLMVGLEPNGPLARVLAGQQPGQPGGPDVGGFSRDGPSGELLRAGNGRGKEVLPPVYGRGYRTPNLLLSQDSGRTLRLFSVSG